MSREDLDVIRVLAELRAALPQPSRASDETIAAFERLASRVKTRDVEPKPRQLAAVDRFRQRVAMGAGLRDVAQSIAIDIDDAQAALDEIDRLTAALEAVRRELSKHGVS